MFQVFKNIIVAQFCFLHEHHWCFTFSWGTCFLLYFVVRKNVVNLLVVCSIQCPKHLALSNFEPSKCAMAKQSQDMQSKPVAPKKAAKKPAKAVKATPLAMKTRKPAARKVPTWPGTCASSAQMVVASHGFTYAKLTGAANFGSKVSRTMAATWGTSSSMQTNGSRVCTKAWVIWKKVGGKSFGL